VFDLPRRAEFFKVAFHLFDSSRRPLLEEEGTKNKTLIQASPQLDARVIRYEESVTRYKTCFYLIRDVRYLISGGH
jgi:hypothetical protein